MGSESPRRMWRLRRSGRCPLLPLSAVADQGAQDFQIHGLGHEIVGACLERLDGQLDVAVGGNDGDGQFAVGAADFPHQVDAAAVGQAHVGQAQGVGMPGQKLARLGQVRGLVAGQAHATQGEFQQGQDVRFVIDEENGGARLLHGINPF